MVTHVVISAAVHITPFHGNPMALLCYIFRLIA